MKEDGLWFGGLSGINRKQRRRTYTPVELGEQDQRKKTDETWASCRGRSPLFSTHFLKAALSTVFLIMKHGKWCLCAALGSGQLSWGLRGMNVLAHLRFLCTAHLWHTTWTLILGRSLEKASRELVRGGFWILWTGIPFRLHTWENSGKAEEAAIKAADIWIKC